MENFDYETYYSSLEVLSYEELVKLLENQEVLVIISFREDKDYSTNKTYHFIEVRNLIEDKCKYYLSPDQDVNDIEIKLHAALDNSKKEKDYYVYESEWRNDFICKIGKNYVNFPDEVTKREVAAIREARKNSTQKEAPVRKRKRKRKSPSWDDLLKEIQNGKN